MTWLLVTRCTLWPSRRLLGLIPGIHIAQFHYQVIGNCGVISLVQRSNGMACSAASADIPTAAEPLPGGEARNMTVSWQLGLCEYCGRGPGVALMMVVMLVAGIGCLLVGLLAIAFGIPVKEFSFGNTLILTGAVAACTGLIILGLWVVDRELKGIGHRLGPGVPMDWRGAPRQPAAAVAPPRRPSAEGGGADHPEHTEP